MRIYITQNRSDLFPRWKKSNNDIIFYFPHEEVQYIHDSVGVEYFFYTNSESSNLIKELSLQEKIINNVFLENLIIVIDNKDIDKFKEFLEIEVNNPRYVDIIYLNFKLKTEQSKRDIFMRSGRGQLFPFYKNKRVYFKKRKFDFKVNKKDIIYN